MHSGIILCDIAKKKTIKRDNVKCILYYNFFSDIIWALMRENLTLLHDQPQGLHRLEKYLNIEGIL